METSDVIIAERDDTETSGTRYTAHLFDVGYAGSGVSPGSAVRSPSDDTNWPSDVLFDVIYASAVARNFLVYETHAAIGQWVEEHYLSKGPTTRKEREENEREAHKDYLKKKKKKGDQKRNVRATNRGLNKASDKDKYELDGLDYITYLPYILNRPEVVRALQEKAEEEAAARNCEESASKVSVWMERLPTNVQQARRRL